LALLPLNSSSWTNKGIVSKTKSTSGMRSSIYSKSNQHYRKWSRTDRRRSSCISTAKLVYWKSHGDTPSLRKRILARLQKHE
jgi:hypothetical protein